MAHRLLDEASAIGQDRTIAFYISICHEGAVDKATVA